VIHYATVTLKVDPTFAGSDEVVIEALYEVANYMLMPISRAEVVSNPDDGRMVRFSTQLDEDDDDILDYLPDLYLSGGPWVRQQAKVVTTLHSEEFDDANIWPEDQMESWLAERGWKKANYRVTLPDWFPPSFVQSIVSDIIGVTLSMADFIVDESIRGVGMDNTMRSMPEVSVWMTDDAWLTCRDADVQSLIEEVIAAQCDNPWLRRWMQLLRDEQTYLTSSEGDE
jgi:hypothetical protein